MVSRIRSIRRRPGGAVKGVLGGSLIGFVLAAVIWRISDRAAPPRVINDTQPIVAAYDMVELPVPAEPVLEGTQVRDIAFHRISYPRHQIPPGALTDLQQVRDSVSVTALPAHVPLFSDNFTQKKAGINYVISHILPGMRAMTVKVDATSSVEGWAGSGSVVDVLLISHEKTSVIAEKVKVLSAERVVLPVEGTSSPHVPSTVTLLVDQEQCLAINTAIPLGKIAFALRSPDDGDGWISAQYTADRLRGRGSVAADRSASISGYVSISGKDGEKAFALSGDKWVKTGIVPEGFRVMNPEAD